MLGHNSKPEIPRENNSANFRVRPFSTFGNFTHAIPMFNLHLRNNGWFYVAVTANWISKHVQESCSELKILETSSIMAEVSQASFLKGEGGWHRSEGELSW